MNQVCYCTNYPFQIQDLFLPSNSELGQKMNYGYVIHPQQQGLYKVDLTALKSVKQIDLKQYSCVPRALAFVLIGESNIGECLGIFLNLPRASAFVNTV